MVYSSCEHRDPKTQKQKANPHEHSQTRFFGPKQNWTENPGKKTPEKAGTESLRRSIFFLFEFDFLLSANFSPITYTLLHQQ